MLFFGCAPSTCRTVQPVSNVECRITAATPGECEIAVAGKAAASPPRGPADRVTATRAMEQPVAAVRYRLRPERFRSLE